MSHLTVQPITDLEAFAQALALWRPDRARTAAALHRRDQERLRGEHVIRRWVQREGKCVGAYSLETPRLENQTDWLDLLVAAPQEEDLPALIGLGLEEAQQLRAKMLVARVRQGRPEVTAYEQASFAEYDRMFESRLDLERFDAAPLAAYTARMQSVGLRILSLAEATTPTGFDEAAARKLYALTVSRLLDMPAVQSPTPWPFEVWFARVGQKMNPAGVFVAVTPDGEWVGLTELFLEQSPGVVHTGLTGVERTWQGQGVAYALKVAALQAARQRGYRETRTGNHASNTPMLAVNRRLGFVLEPATLLLQRPLL